MPSSRRIVPCAKPSTKKPMKYRTISRSTVLMLPRNAPRSTHSPPFRASGWAGAGQG